MFRKLVSNLSFSPALVGQLGFYAKRLKKEEAVRRVGLIFTVLALVVQYFAVFQAPEPANAADPRNMVYGGTWSFDAVVGSYDRNENNIRDLYDAVGISRQDIINAVNGGVKQSNSRDGTYSWSLKPTFSAAQGAGSYKIPSRTFYYNPHHLWESENSGRIIYYTYYGGVSSKTGMHFRIMRACGNLITWSIPPAPACPPGQVGTWPNCTTPPKMCTIDGKTNLKADDPNCKEDPKCAIPGKTNLKANDPNCKEDPVATCDDLSIVKNGSNYQYTATGSTKNGAKITSYTFTIYRDGKLIKTLKNQTENIVIDKQTTPGKYEVKLTIHTSIGDKTSASCVKTFIIPEPKKCPQNPSLLATDPNCQPCPGDNTLWIKDPKCKEDIVQTKTAQNASKGNIDATTATAQASDQIIYKINVTNKGLNATEYTISEDLDDVLQYAELSNLGGGKLVDDTTGSRTTKTLLTWPKITLKPGETQTRVFSVKLLSNIPPTATGTSHPGSYDCKMTNIFGNTVTIDVDCPVQKKVVESVVAELPHTGPAENMMVAGVVLSVVAFFYARSRQLKKEIRLIRRDFNTGTI